MSVRGFLLCILIVPSVHPLVVSAIPCLAPPTIQATVLSVTDGDTIRVRIESAGLVDLPLGLEIAVRYTGINTPETDPVERFGPEASELNRALVSARRVFLELDAEQRDQYGRLLAYVYLDAQGNAMVNALLVALGFAFASPVSPNTRYETLFHSLEVTAREEALGVWSNCSCGATTFKLGSVDARGESIEIVNVSGDEADLFGWVISDGEGSYTFRTHLVIQPGESYTCSISEYNPDENTQGLKLGNDSDQVYLSCPSGEVVDQTSW